MNPLNLLAAAALVALAGCSALPGSEAKQPDEHAAHHPADAASKADTAKVDQQMKMMEDMHQKMQAAKTPAERATLMKDHMATMKESMAMMGQMRGGMSMQERGRPATPGAGPMPKEKDLMQRRMDMMEMMMQMMMDREAARPPVAR